MKEIKKIELTKLSVFLILVAVFFCSCRSSKVNNDFVYFKNGSDTTSMPLKKTIIQPYDLLSIRVLSRTTNQEQAAIFNATKFIDELTDRGYQVNSEGNIEMPVIGPVQAAGLTIDQLRTSLTTRLDNYVKSPSVLINFLQFNINVMGEVKTPGIQKFLTDRVTVIDAISSAGDLTDYGRRDEILVIREVNGKRITHKVDLRSRKLFESPVYYLQPNDIVYVSPNKVKIKNLDIDPEAQRRSGLFFSIASMVLSVASIIVFAVRQ